MATITDLPFDDPCNAAVERNSIRLEREADNWREAVGAGGPAAARATSPPRLCGPPVAFFLLGRHDLADVVRPLLDAVRRRRPRQRRAVLCALIVSAVRRAPIRASCRPGPTRSQAIDDASSPTGLGGLMRWLALGVAR